MAIKWKRIPQTSTTPTMYESAIGRIFSIGRTEGGYECWLDTKSGAIRLGCVATLRAAKMRVEANAK